MEYFFTLDKKSIINISWLFRIFKVNKLENYYNKISNFYRNIFIKKRIVWEEFKNYKNRHDFNEMSSIYYTLWLFLNWDKFEKRVYDCEKENYLSIFSKILLEINNNKKWSDEKYDFFISRVLENLDLDFYEKSYMNYHHLI